MPHNQSNKADKPIYCIACGKVIGQGYIVAGSIQLLCKCGVKTKIEAEHKPEGQKREFINIDTSSSVEMFRRAR